MMRVLKIAVLAAVLVGAAADVPADEAEMGLSLGSAYVRRGITMNDRPVLQPFSDFRIDIFSVNAWGNINLDEYDRIQNHGLFSEVDLTLSCVFSVDTVDYKVGWIEYLYPDGADTRELFGIARMLLSDELFTDIGVYYDMDEKDDFYARGRVGYIMSIADSLDAQLAGSLAAAGDGMSVGERGGLHDYSLSLDITHGAETLRKITASLVYTGSLDSDVLPDQSVNFYITCGVTIGF